MLDKAVLGIFIDSVKFLGLLPTNSHMFPVLWYHTVQRFAVSYSVTHKDQYWLLSTMHTLFLRTCFLEKNF